MPQYTSPQHTKRDMEYYQPHDSKNAIKVNINSRNRYLTSQNNRMGGDKIMTR